MVVVWGARPGKERENGGDVTSREREERRRRRDGVVMVHLWVCDGEIVQDGEMEMQQPADVVCRLSDGRSTCLLIECGVSTGSISTCDVPDSTVT